MIRFNIRTFIPSFLEYRSVAFFLLDVRRELPQPTSSDLWFDSHVIASMEDGWLKELCDTWPDKYFHLRMRHEGERCYIALVDGKLAAYAWVTSCFCHVSEINLSLSVGTGYLYIYDCFVIPEWRSRGIYSALLVKIVDDFRHHPGGAIYHTACIGADPRNLASVAGIKRAGFAEYTRARYVRAGKFSHCHGMNELSARMRSGVFDKVQTTLVSD